MAGDAVTVVLPCLNEEESLPAVLAAIPAGYRALVVDNNSTDDTATVAARHGAQVVVEPRPGYGSAVHAGVLAATTPIVAVIDADGSMDAGDLPKLVAELDKGADLVTGRRRPVAGLHWPWVARVGTVVMSWRLRTRHRLPVHDIAPMRVARREALLDLGVVDRRSGYLLELLVRRCGGLACRRTRRQLRSPDRRQIQGQRFAAGQHHRDPGLLEGDLVSCLPVSVLVVAKAPEPGRVKTRLAAAIGDKVAADIAAAALLDTLDAVAAAPVTARAVALTGDLDSAADSAEIRRRLKSFTVFRQRGDAFADRLANAHVDAADGYPVLQIGMDTPQVTAELLADCARLLLQIPAVLGLAFDGGWWVLGIRTPTAAECLRAVPMSQPDTGELTLKALRDNGIDVTLVQRLGDFDIVDDIALVRDCCAPGSRFAQATRAAGL